MTLKKLRRQAMIEWYESRIREIEENPEPNALDQYKQKIELKQLKRRLNTLKGVEKALFTKELNKELYG